MIIGSAGEPFFRRPSRVARPDEAGAQRDFASGPMAPR
jgi:hypothetical protein